jgi:hypothetical protein
MSCPDLAELLAQYAVGAGEPSIGAHLDGCADCRRQVQEYRRVLHLLDSAPALEPSAQVWERLRASIAPAPIAWRRRLAALAAALLLGAILSYWIITSAADAPPAAVVSFAAPGAPLAPGTRVQRLQTSHYVELSLPGVGTLSVRPNSALELTDPRTVRLTGGELFASIDRGPFTIESNLGNVRVLGTRFGVRAEPGATTVSVIEGTVRVRDRLSVGAGEVLTCGKDGEIRATDPYGQLAWLAAHRPPAPALESTLEGDALIVTITNAGPAPLVLAEIGDWSQYLTLQVRPQGRPPYTISLPSGAAALTEAYRRPDGRIQIDPSHPLTFRIALDPPPDLGPAELRPCFTVKSVDSDSWHGMIEAARPVPYE